MIVVDAGVLATALADDGEQGHRMLAGSPGRISPPPAVIDLEVASVLRQGLRAGLLTEHRAALALSDLIDMPFERVPHTGLLRRVWERHHHVTPYDAAYAALAELLSAVLATTDARLGRAPGLRCAIEVV